MTSGWQPENILDVLGCEIARSILALGSVRPFSAQEFANRCEVSDASIYRRLEVLSDYDLLTEDIVINPDGNDYTRYETNLEAVEIRIEDAAFELELEQDQDYTEKFLNFWTHLEEGTADIEPDIGPAVSGSPEMTDN